MTIINLEKNKEADDFAKKAAEHFRDNPPHFTYAESDPAPGHLFAIRWNPYTVLVIRLHDEEIVRLYAS